MTSTLLQLKAQNDSRLADEKRIIDRKRNVLVLIQQYCTEAGYLHTVERLIQEAGIALSKFEVIENIDLLRIVQEYEEYQEVKFGKKPKLVRRVGNDGCDKSMGTKENNNDAKKRAAAERRQKRNDYTSTHMPSEAKVENNAALKAISKSTTISNNTKPHASSNSSSNSQPPESDIDLGLVGCKPAQRSDRSMHNNQSEKASNPETEDSIEERILKPFPMFLNDSELKPLADTITREIYQKDPNVHWDDVIGLFETKRLLKEAVVLPLKYPQLFQGLLSPWTGILLFGPPGNGKTMLAKAVATECKTTFFNISASSIVSKYRGDSEKLIRVLFELARYHAPSTIFLDEIDSIMGHRDGSGGGGNVEHEASRRMKTELLIQMDGLSKTNEMVFILAASNLPWELDAALLRRLEKRVLVDLPSADARLKLFSSLLQPYIQQDFSFESTVSRTEGYSGADIKLVAKEACMGSVRRLLATLEAMEMQKVEEKGKIKSGVSEECSWKSLMGFIQPNDMEQALSKTKPSAQHLLKKYHNWQTKYGST